MSTAPATSRVQYRYRVWLLFVILVVLVLRIMTAATVPLFSVEAYYWLWNRHLAAGYFDHPPMVAWMARCCFGWIDGSELAARTSALALGALSVGVVYWLAREFTNRAAAACFAALYAIVPVFDLNGILLQPDNSLILFMLLTWLFFWRAANLRNRMGLWVAVGLFAGLALLSKFHAWVLLPPLWLFLVISRQHRPLLRTAGPWIAAAIALITVSPNLVWNAQHDWLNYRFQWQRSDIPRAHWRLENVLVFWLAPIASLSPLLFIAMLRGIGRGVRAWRGSEDSRVLFLLCAGLPLPLLLACLAPFVTINPHWPSAGFLPLLLLAFVLGVEHTMFSRRFWISAAAVAGVFTLVMHAAPFVIRAAPDPHAGEGKEFVLNPVRAQRELLPWKTIGERVRARIEESTGTRVLMSANWHTAALLAFYARQPRNTYCLEASDAHNFELWRRDAGGLAGEDALVVLAKGNPNYRHETLITKYDKFHRYLDPLFETVESLPSIRIYADGTLEEKLGTDVSRAAIAEFLVFRCDRFRRPLP